VTREAIAESFELQATWCAAMSSPLYAELLVVAADDLRGGGPVEQVVGDYDEEPVAAALALRFLGGVHRLVLMGLADRLATHYPSVGGEPDSVTLADDFLAAVAAHRGYLRSALRIAPQTNDIGRSAALLPAIGAALDGRRLRIRMLELGAAAGLNLLVDRYRYDMGRWQWGAPGSPLVSGRWGGPHPAVPKRLDVVERRGCDIAPIDVGDAEARLRILSFVWPDHHDRMERMQAAIRVARAEPPAVDRADAPSWLANRLDEPSPRRTLTVVQHSVMWQYLPADARTSILRTLDTAGQNATGSRPLAHVSFEPGHDRDAGSGFAIVVRTWPGGEERMLGTGHAHGRWIEWGEPSPGPVASSRDAQ
jgi:hypothetical protein